jgi:hypothetical protein
VAHVVRRFEFEPYETTVDNICVFRDLGIGCPEKGLFDVKAKVKSIREK